MSELDHPTDVPDSQRPISKPTESAIGFLLDETPYGMAIFKDLWKSFCGHCGLSQSVMITCPMNCAGISYCNEVCENLDRASHFNECHSFRSRQTRHADHLVEMRVRLCGRLLSQYSIDRGVHHLSSEIPSKDRCFDELESHTSEFDQSEDVKRDFKMICTSFYTFFNGTTIWSVEADPVLKTIYYRILVNAMTVTACTEANCLDLGEAVYLNSSRFDHSCEPECVYRFEGSRLKIYLNDSTRFGKLTSDQFDGLTICYNCGPEWTNGCSIGFKEQRDQAFSCRYGFRCQCKCCADNNYVQKEADSANIECKICQSPFVWSEADGKRILKPICSCLVDKPAIDRYVEEYGPKLVQLIDKWGPLVHDAWLLINSIRKGDDLRLIAIRCANLFDSAIRIWNPRWNVRLGQLCEIGFLLYDAIRGNRSLSNVELDQMINFGETALTIYGHYLPSCAVSVGNLAVKLARLASSNVERSTQWFNFAKKLYEERREFKLAEEVEREIQSLMKPSPSPEESKKSPRCCLF